MGLGTRAVDRTQQDYPRLANLDRPAATLHSAARTEKGISVFNTRR